MACGGVCEVVVCGVGVGDLEVAFNASTAAVIVPKSLLIASIFPVTRKSCAMIAMLSG